MIIVSSRLATLSLLTLTLICIVRPTEAVRGDLVGPGINRPLTSSAAGAAVDIAIAFVRQNAAGLGLTAADFDDLRLVDSYRTKHNGLTHVYLRQRLDGIEVMNGDIAVHVGADGRVWRVNSNFASALRASVNGAAPRLDAAAAVTVAVAHLGLTLREPLTVAERSPGVDQLVVFGPAGISLEPIRVRLVYYEPTAGSVRLAWNLAIAETSAPDWWNMVVDAETGTVIGQFNWTARDSYRTYELPIASPNHSTPPPPGDGRVSVVDPADPVASPYGWHSTTTTPGEFQASRGNNVDAYEDQDNSDDPTGGDAARAVGTASLDFDFPLDLTLAPGASVGAAITNLFYANNAIHDILHGYGFDEPSGNFQVNNYSRGGDGSDDVRAEGQDGGGRNNANFSTLIDGQRPRMQMYLWDPPRDREVLTVESPAAIAREYGSMGAVSAPAPPPPGITRPIVLVDDGSAAPDEGCGTLVNAAAINGNIALALTGGGCFGDTKAINAQAAGAVALILMHRNPSAPLVAPTGTFPIPTVLIVNSDGLTIRSQLPTPGVIGTLMDESVAGVPDADSCNDNEIIIHEYGHGVSNRLVGGRLNVDCLNNQEQAGEGWSDLLGLMLTVKPGDVGADPRGLGAYSAGGSPTSAGLRPYPYSTDLTRSPLTYGDLGSLVVPHGTGSMWAAVGWEVYWALTERYGFDPDMVNGTGGNNLALRLIIDGMKLTNCSPGYVDNRDAIITADQVFTGGANECLLWTAFAKRGLGVGADQGDAGTVGDETEAFDVPATCVCPPAVELANVVRAWHGAPVATDVQLDFSAATGSAWRIFRDPLKSALRVTPLSPDALTTSYTDVGAVDVAAGARLFYRITEVDCVGDAGP